MSNTETQTSVRDRSRQNLDRVDRDLAAGVPMKTGEGGALQIVPSNMDQAMEFAVMMSKAGDMIRPQFRNNPGACLAISMFAWRVGLDPFVVSNKAYITVNTKGGGHVTQVAYEAQLIHAIINLRAPLAKRLRAVYSGEGPTRRVKIVGFIQGEDEPLEYESPEFKDIKVTNSPLWQADRDQQFWYYGTRAWARRHFPEIIMGAYTRDEIEDGLGDPEVVTLTEEERQAARQARPQRGASSGGDRVIDAEVDEAGTGSETAASFEIQLIDGEVRGFTDPQDFAAAFLDAMKQAFSANDAKGLDGLWETNSGQLELLRLAEGGAALAEDCTTSYRDWEAKLKQQAAAARNVPDKTQETTETVAPTKAAGVAQEKPATANATPAKAPPAKTEPAKSEPARVAAPSKPEPWIFKHIGGRNKEEVADAAAFAAAIRKTCTEQGFSPNNINTFMMMLNKAGMERLERVDPDLHARVLQHARDVSGWEG